MIYRIVAILLICLSSFGATQKIVQTDLNNIVQQPTNFWNSQPSDVLFSNAVNAVAGSGVSTNGLATTNFVISYAYPTSNPSLFVTASVTNGLVGAGITNGLATTNFVNNAIVGFVTASITNGLATTNYATTQAQNFAQQATNGLVIPSTNGFVTSSVTNGLATTNYVNNATNGLLSAIPATATNLFVLTNDVVWFDRAADRVALTNGYLRTIPTGATNQFTATNDTTWFASKSSVASAVVQGGVATNLSFNLASNTAAFFVGSNSVGAEITITNSNPSGWSGVTAQADNGNFLTNYIGFYINNSAFVPGSTWVGSTNDGVLEYNGKGNMFVDSIGQGNTYFITRTATNSAVSTNVFLSPTNSIFYTPIQAKSVSATNYFASRQASLPTIVLTNLYGSITNLVFSPLSDTFMSISWSNIVSLPFYTNILQINLANPVPTTNSLFIYGVSIINTNVSNSSQWASVTVRPNPLQPSNSICISTRSTTAPASLANFQINWMVIVPQQ